MKWPPPGSMPWGTVGSAGLRRSVDCAGFQYDGYATTSSTAHATRIASDRTPPRERRPKAAISRCHDGAKEKQDVHAVGGDAQDADRADEECRDRAQSDAGERE